MFEAVKQSVTLGATELDLVAAAEEVSHRHGFGEQSKCAFITM